MRRPAVLLAVWIVGGVLAVALATAAVSRVGNQVTGDRPAPLSADDVRRELAAEAATSSSAPDATVLPVDTSTSTSTSLTSPTTAVTATEPTTTVPAETRTYPLIGGTATLRFSPSGVTVVVANPNPGFSVEVEPQGNGVEVSFRSASHRSKVEAWWDGGPRDEIEEEAESED